MFSYCKDCPAWEETGRPGIGLCRAGLPTFVPDSNSGWPKTDKNDFSYKSPLLTRDGEPRIRIGNLDKHIIYLME